MRSERAAEKTAIVLALGAGSTGEDATVLAFGVGSTGTDATVLALGVGSTDAGLWPSVFSRGSHCEGSAFVGAALGLVVASWTQSAGSHTVAV